MGGGFGGCTLSLVDDFHRESFVNNIVEGFYDDFKYEVKVEPVEFSDGFEVR